MFIYRTVRISLLCICLVVSFLALPLQGQDIRGVILDDQTKEALIGAYVTNNSTGKTITTDKFGSFTTNASEEKSLSLRITYLGYGTLDTTITSPISPLIIGLASKAELPTIEIVYQDVERRTRNALAIANIPVALLNALPSLAGETDPIKSLQLLPGIAAGVEGTSDLYVRGGTPDQNLILLDGAKIYNANHLLGFLSPVNPSLVKNIKLYKSGFPARFGGRLSSVLEVETEGGNKSNWETTVGVGLINSRFQISGPLKKGRSSISVGGRTAHLSLLNSIATNEESFQTYSFYDLNLKANWQYDKSNIALAFFRNYDRTVVAQNTVRTPLQGIFDYGNITGSARWSYALSEKFTLISLLTGNYYNYRAKEELSISEEIVEATSNISTIRELDTKLLLKGYLNNNLSLEAGLEGSLRRINPRNVESTNENLAVGFRPEENSQDLAAFADVTLDVINDLALQVGVRLQNYFLLGSNKAFTYLEPRINLSYSLNKKATLSTSYTRMSQGLHMISNNFVGIPTNLWVTANERVVPTRGTQFSLGGGYNSEKFNLAIDAYYKTTKNVIDPLPGVGFFQSSTENWENDISAGGENQVRGVELFYQHKGDRLFGWFTYNLIWNRIRYNQINNGEWYFRQFDRRHDLSIVTGYRLNDKWQLLTNFVLNSGFRLTLPIATRYDGLSNTIIPVYRERYNGATPIYHRLDVTFRREKVRKNGRKRVFAIGCYNVYGRQNPTYVLAEQDSQSEFDDVSISYLPNIISNDITQYSLFTFIPFINYEITF